MLLLMLLGVTAPAPVMILDIDDSEVITVLALHKSWSASFAI